MDVADDQLDLVEVSGGLDDGRDVVDTETVQQDAVVRLDVRVAAQLRLQLLRAVRVEGLDEDYTWVQGLLGHLEGDKEREKKWE